MKKTAIVAIAISLIVTPTMAVEQPSNECLHTGNYGGKAVFLGSNQSLEDFEIAIEANEAVHDFNLREIGNRLALSFIVVDLFAEREERWSFELRKQDDGCWHITRAKLNDEPPVDGILAYSLLSVLFPTDEPVTSSTRRIPRADVGTRSQ